MYVSMHQFHYKGYTNIGFYLHEIMRSVHLVSIIPHIRPGYQDILTIKSSNIILMIHTRMIFSSSFVINI